MLKTDLKKSQIVQIGANLTDFGAKPDIPAQYNAMRSIVAQYNYTILSMQDRGQGGDRIIELLIVIVIR